MPRIQNVEFCRSQAWSWSMVEGKKEIDIRCYVLIRFLKMSFERFRSLWNSTSENKEQSILDRTQTFISNSFRRTITPVNPTAEFDDYLASIPPIKKVKKQKVSPSSSLKPELIKKCFEVVDNQFFHIDYEIDNSWFDKRSRNNLLRQQQLQQQLDEVEMSSRFDQILSVLRTIESLDFIVLESERKIATIRQQNFSKVIKISQKQTKMTGLIAKKRKLEAVVELASKLKQYREFLEVLNNSQRSDALQTLYTAIPALKSNIRYFTKLRAAKNLELRLEEAESNLKQSFSDKINERIFDYLKRDVPYQLEFWRKYINSNKILEDREDESRDHTTLLDESNIITEEESLVILPKKEEPIEIGIVEFIRNGWKDGEYVEEKLKVDIETFLKSKHNAFLLDFRNFCDQFCKKYDRHIENPSLSNLLRQINITFCIKVYNYFFDIHKSIILRFFSTARKVFEFLISLNTENLTIEQKQKIKTIGEGFVKSGVFITRLIIQKLVDIIDTKILHEGVNIMEIKQVIEVMENAEIFIQKQVIFLQQTPNGQKSIIPLTDLSCRFPLKLLQTGKTKKLQSYLNKIHQNAMQVQLKQHLQNQTWQPTDIPIFYYDSLHYLITGDSLNLRRNRYNLKNLQQSSIMYETSVLMDNREESFFQEPKLVGNFRIIRNDIMINGNTYKVTETVLLLLEILEDYMTLAHNFAFIRKDVEFKINQVLRTYNSCSCQLIVHAGAMALQKIKTKNITSRHLGLSSLCVSFLLYIMECLQKRVQIYQYDKLKKVMQQHIEVIVKKLNQILAYKVNQAKPEIDLKNTPSKGTQTIVSNTKILLEILSDYYNKDILCKIFTKQTLHIYVQAISSIKPKTRVEAEGIKDDVAFFFGELKGLDTLGDYFTQERILAQDAVRRAFEEL